MPIPLPFTCEHLPYTAGVVDDHGNTVTGWADSAAVPCFWWSGAASTEPANSDQAAADLTLVIDTAVPVDHRDRFTVEGRLFEVIGLPKDYDHGPFGFTPNRRVVELHWVG